MRHFWYSMVKKKKQTTKSSFITLKNFSSCGKRIPLVARGWFFYCIVIKELKGKNWDKHELLAFFEFILDFHHIKLFNYFLITLTPE